MNYIQYNFTYQPSTNDVLISDSEGWSATISSTSSLYLIDDKIIVPISQSTNLKISLKEVNLLNGSTLVQLGITNVSQLYSQLNLKCFGSWDKVSNLTTPITFKGYPNENEFSYSNSVLTATGGNFSTAITTLDVDNIVLANSALNQWIVIGQDSLGSIITSIKIGNIGEIRRITSNKGLSATITTFPNSTAIPSNAITTRIDVSTIYVIISTSIDGINYVEWSRILKTSISSTYTKRLGILNISTGVNVYSSQIVGTSYVGIDSSTLSDVALDSDYLLLLNPIEPSGMRKRKIKDILDTFRPIFSDVSNFNKIIATGTSITAGVGASISTNKWVDVAQSALTSALGRTITIVNGGVSGQTTSGMLSNLPNLLSSNDDAKIVIIEAGINDSKFNASGGIDLSVSRSNLQSMITLVKNANMIPIINTPISLDMSVSSVSTNFDNSKRTALCLIANDLARINNIRCADINLFTSQDFSLLNDGLHPNDKGHLVWANIICSTILK